MVVLYTAVKRFDVGCGEAWTKYIAWSRLIALHEVVSLDAMLCPSLFDDLTYEDWSYNVQADFKIDLFYDLDHVLQRTADKYRVNVLALLENPMENEVRSFQDSRFDFRGFDLMDLQMSVSALVNCGGFDLAFAPADLSPCGLLTDHALAIQVQKRLRAEYPNEVHANCDVWAIWQMKAEASTASGQRKQ
jgi:hypothetical protein